MKVWSPAARVSRKALTARLLARADIDEIVLLDMAPAKGVSDPRVRVVAGDISDPALMESLIDEKDGGRLSPRRGLERPVRGRIRHRHAHQRGASRSAARGLP
jgi:hypothetical protein